MNGTHSLILWNDELSNKEMTERILVNHTMGERINSGHPRCCLAMNNHVLGGSLTRSMSTEEGKRSITFANDFDWIPWGTLIWSTDFYSKDFWWNRDSFYLIYAKGAGPSLDDGMLPGSQGTGVCAYIRWRVL